MKLLWLILIVLAICLCFDSDEGFGNDNVRCDNYDCGGNSACPNCPIEDGCSVITFKSKDNSVKCARFNPATDCEGYMNGKCPEPGCVDSSDNSDEKCMADPNLN